MEIKEREIEHLKAEIEYYKKMLKWYQDTYENRSMLGVVKDKLNKKIKNISTSQKIKNGHSKALYINNRNPKDEILYPIDNSSFYASHAIDPQILKIAIFIHLFYHDLWDEINNYLTHSGINFDLFITLNEEDEHCDSTIEKIKESYPSAIIIKTPNQGLDIGPFFELMNYALSKKLTYDYILKIHTKKSLGVNSFVGESWRKKSYESLMGSQSIIFHILRLFAANKNIGMIGPYETKMSSSVNDFQKGSNVNAVNIKLLSNKLEIKDQQLDFFGGTMFWAKWPILENKFKRKTLFIHDFESGYKNDELLAHAMERLFASIIRDAGYSLYELNKVHDYLFYKNRKKKICWVHPGYGIGGGNRVIFEICQEQLKYYDVYSISFMGHPFNNWINVSHMVLNFSNENEATHFIETMNMDYVFATGWQTVDFVKTLRDSIKKYYFIQDYEPWFGNTDSNAVKATYNSKSFNKFIVIAEWLKKQLLKEHKEESIFVKLGTRKYLTKIKEADEENNTKKILLYFKLKSHTGRGADLILELLKKLSKIKTLELNVFGHEDPEVDGVKFHGELHKEKLIDLYRNNDFFIDMSRHRGIATIALEVAQFGVVSFLSAKNFGLREYGFLDNTNCVFVNDVNDAYNKIITLANDSERFQHIRQGVLTLSKSFDWAYTANDINQVIDILS